MEAVKNDENKTELNLLPVLALEKIGSVFSFGAKKYSNYNWSKGLLYSRIFAATLRHLFSWWKGEELDEESGKSHLYHAGCCILMLIETQELELGEDDRPQYYKKQDNDK
jgi:hypothetical protein